MDKLFDPVATMLYDFDTDQGIEEEYKAQKNAVKTWAFLRAVMGI